MHVRLWSRFATLRLIMGDVRKRGSERVVALGLGGRDMFAGVARMYPRFGRASIHRLGATLACALLIMTITPAPAAADLFPPALADITLSPLTVNPQTGIGHFTVNVTCVISLTGLVRTRATLTQTRGQALYASSFNTGGAFGCTAGQRLALSMQFGGQQGSFLPGPATIYGFVEHFSPYPGVLSYDARTVLIHPEH
jgi:hypothetical protein